MKLVVTLTLVLLPLVFVPNRGSVKSQLTTHNHEGTLPASTIDFSL
jgi:hypothetical protein